MTYKNLLFEIKNHTALVTINRPDKLNALNGQTIDELEDVFKSIKNNDEIFVVVITGSGEKAFVAGADIAELNKLDVISAKEFSEKGNRIFREIETLGKPVIAALHGYALGAGLALSLLCDIRLAAENTKLGAGFPAMGLVPELGMTYTLPELVGIGRALELSLTANRFDAAEALRIGLINKVLQEEKLLEEALAMARQMAQLPPLALKWTKKAIRCGAEGNLEDSFRLESHMNALCYSSEDHKEATSAFFEKRKPIFKGK